MTPTANDAGATIAYLDGSDAALTDADAGKTGFQVDLGVGDTVVKVKVTAEDDSTTETYQVTVTRAAAGCTDPKAIWCATMTVGEFVIPGEISQRGYYPDSGYGAISDDEFTHDGVTYKLVWLFDHRFDRLIVGLDPEGTTVFDSRFTLHIGTEKFSLGDASLTGMFRLVRLGAFPELVGRATPSRSSSSGPPPTPR